MGAIVVLVGLAFDAGYVGYEAAGMLDQGVFALVAQCVTVSLVVYQIDQHLGL